MSITCIYKKNRKVDTAPHSAPAERLLLKGVQSNILSKETLSWGMQKFKPEVLQCCAIYLPSRAWQELTRGQRPENIIGKRDDYGSATRQQCRSYALTR